MKKVNDMRKGLRRLIWAALAVGLVAALVKLGEDREALAARQAAERTRIENLYHRIDDDLNDVDVSLSKLSAASSPRQSVLLLGDVWRATGSAGAAMGLLPLSHADSCDMSQFVTRCGDYVRAACAQIRQVAGEAIQSGDYVAADNVDAGCYEQSQSEAAISEYPTLIYDGPFSESAENRPPQGEIGERITAQQAAERARRLFSDGTVAETVYVPGALPVYELSVQSASRGQVSLSLTEQGGELLSFMGAPTGDKTDPPSDEESEKLKAAALSFLQ